mgnify:CR=1 FL=1
MGVGELLLELAGEAGLEGLELLVEAVGGEDDSSLLAASDLDLLGRAEVKGLEARELRGLLELDHSLSNALLERGDGLAVGLNNLVSRH